MNPVIRGLATCSWPPSTCTHKASHQCPLIREGIIILPSAVWQYGHKCIHICNACSKHRVSQGWHGRHKKKKHRSDITPDPGGHRPQRIDMPGHPCAFLHGTQASSRPLCVAGCVVYAVHTKCISSIIHPSIPLPLPGSMLEVSRRSLPYALPDWGQCHSHVQA